MPARYLFDEFDSAVPRETFSIATTHAKALSSEHKDALRTRAAQGDRDVLREAHQSSDGELYNEVLTTLVESLGDSTENLRALMSYIAESDGLRANTALAEAARRSWEISPNSGSTAEMLHCAALSDDAETYRRAVEAAVQYWREGKMPRMSATELWALMDSEYWVLASGAVASGEGFVLKRKLVEVRRQLATASRRASSSVKQDFQQ